MATYKQSALAKRLTTWLVPTFGVSVAIPIIMATALVFIGYIQFAFVPIAFGIFLTFFGSRMTPGKFKDFSEYAYFYFVVGMVLLLLATPHFDTRHLLEAKVATTKSDIATFKGAIQ